MPGVYYVNISSQILFCAIFALGLNVLAGYAGLVSLGHAGLLGIAGYAVGYMLQPASATPSPFSPRSLSGLLRWRSSRCCRCARPASAS